MKPTHQRQLWGIVLAAGEGTRVRKFLSQLCGGRGIKQFCAITGRRSLLQHTLDRVEPGRDRQARFRFRVANEVDDGHPVEQGAAAPILGNEADKVLVIRRTTAL